MNIPLDQQNIINILGIESLPDERKVALVEQATDLVQKRLLLRVLENLDEAKKNEFEELLESGSDVQLADFIKTSAPNFGAWVDEEIYKVKQELADVASSIDKGAK